MNDFRQNILDDAIARLQSLQKKLKDNFSVAARREAFQVIHSTKGLSQTFGFRNAAQIAEKLETFLNNSKPDAPGAEVFLSEGIGLLIDSLKNTSFRLPADFAKKISRQSSSSVSQIFFTQIPLKLWKKLSENEKKKIISAYRIEKNIYSALLEFEKTDFARCYTAFQQKILQDGEIIALLPDNQFNNSEKLKFLVLFFNSRSLEKNIQDTAEFAPQITSYSLSAQSLSKEWLTILLQFVEYHEKTAKRLKKKVGLTTLTNDVKISEESSKTVFEILLHLVRNALAHAFSKTGEIEVLFLADEKELFLEFADNGKGIDLEQVKQLAIERQIVPGNADLIDQQILELIFVPEFSTARKVSAIAGRGVGLDIVKTAVQKLNGKISVKSRKDYGTKFEILLPTVL
jgi:chemotaxis protein histidine kinase CheA